MGHPEPPKPPKPKDEPPPIRPKRHWKEDNNPILKAENQNPGGIDLQTQNINWDVRKEGNGVEIRIDPLMVERIKREGIRSLTPVIYRMTPLRDIQALID